MTDAGFVPVRTLSETRRAHAVFFGQVAVFTIGATSSIQLANVTVTALTVVCLLLVPGFLLMKHRGADLVPLVLAALGWISFLASCLVNGVSVLWPNAIAPAAFSLYLIGLTVLTALISYPLFAYVLAAPSFTRLLEAQIVALILRFLRDQGSELGAAQAVRTALTAPSVWTDAKKEVLQSAAEAAGFDMGTLSLEEEPVAAFEYARTLGPVPAVGADSAAIRGEFGG